MKTRNEAVGLILLGAGPRLAAAALIIAVLWAGFFWATGLSWSALGVQP